DSGLSSSAALEVALATAFDAAADLGLPPARRAELAWRAETAFVGVPCGRMDQLASALGRRDHAPRIDCRDFSTALVPVPAAGASARRREESAAALWRARARGLAAPGAAAWRDVPPAGLPALVARLDPVCARRARRVLTESARVDAVAAALAAGDLARAGAQ